MGHQPQNSSKDIKARCAMDDKPPHSHRNPPESPLSGGALPRPLLANKFPSFFADIQELEICDNR